MNQQKGHFFVFEGIDGSGKTTQISLLKNRIEEHQIRCLATKEPTEGPIGSLIRQVLSGRIKMDEYTMAALFAADRLDHLRNSRDGICREMDDGITVISDRYILSAYAYQSVSVPLDWVMQLNAEALSTQKPDCHFFIDIDPDTACQRMSTGRFHTDLYESKSHLTDVRNRYFELIEQLKEHQNIIIIDGNRPVSNVADEIWSKVCHYYV